MTRVGPWGKFLDFSNGGVSGPPVHPIFEYREVAFLGETLLMLDSDDNVFVWSGHEGSQHTSTAGRTSRRCRTRR